jgi:hypothetical protein
MAIKMHSQHKDFMHFVREAASSQPMGAGIASA